MKEATKVYKSIEDSGSTYNQQKASNSIGINKGLLVRAQTNKRMDINKSNDKSRGSSTTMATNSIK